MGNFTFSLDLSQVTSLRSKYYLDQLLHVRLSLSEITSLFGLSRYLDRTFAQRIGSAKVKSKSEVAQWRQWVLPQPITLSRPLKPYTKLQNWAERKCQFSSFQLHCTDCTSERIELNFNQLNWTVLNSAYPLSDGQAEFAWFCTRALLVEQGLTSHLTQFRSFRRRCFYRSDDPTNSVKALKEGG